MTLIRRAFLLASADRYFSMLANFATLAIVSRLLKPEEIGIFVLGTAVVMLAQSLCAFGTPTYIVQKPQLTMDDVRGTFTIMVVIGGAIAAGLALSAPRIAAAYGEPRLVLFLWLAAICTVVDLFATLIVALLSREMAFGKLAVMGVFNAMLHMIVVVVLARMGFGFMCFAWAWLISAIANGALALWMRPGLRIFLPSTTGWRDVLVFGTLNGCNVVLRQIFEQLPYLLLGRFALPTAVGNYNRALLVSRLPERIVLGGAISVVLPAMSKRARESQDLKGPYLRGVELISGLQWPALLVIALLAHPVLRLLLGEQWLSAAPLLQIFTLSALFSFVFQLNYPVLVALGAMRDLFRCSLLVLPVSTVIACGAALLGPQELAFSMLLVVPLQAYVAFYFVRLHMRWEWHELLQALWRSAAVAIASTLGPIMVLTLNGFDVEMSMSLAALSIGLAGGGWLAGLRLTSHPILDEAGPLMRQLRTWSSRATQIAANASKPS